MVAPGSRWQPLAERLFDGAFAVDGELRVTFWNRAAEQLTGRPADELLGLPRPDDLLVRIPDEDAREDGEDDPLAATLRDGRARDAEAWVRHRQGHLIPVRLRTLGLPGPDDSVAGALVLLSDNTPRALPLRQTEETEAASFLDPLTGIANRAAAEHALELRLFALRRHDVPFAVLLADIDELARVNLYTGWADGDRAVCMVARTLHHGVRAATDAVFRWGGEEFVVLVQLTDGDSLRRFCEKLRRLVERCGFAGHGAPVAVTVSIGATRATADDTPQSLLERATAWMARSKEAGCNCATCEPEPPALPQT